MRAIDRCHDPDEGGAQGDATLQETADQDARRESTRERNDPNRIPKIGEDEGRCHYPGERLEEAQDG